MKQRITETSQGIVIYKINPNKEELNGEVDFEKNVHGRILVGDFYICDNTLIVEDTNKKVVGIFSLNHYYFLKSSNT